jgi:hypothetical protein
MKIFTLNRWGIFDFWTPTRPMSRLIGVRLKQKYPTPGFAYTARDEFYPLMGPVWR